ncbi:hypothetical protein Klosneuvirus_3_80 [Klosneuvirus KNV1]|uniref:Uncharacterized protein n=1 Tax=Klosneuvirus KNV1 TaxID=1977640 RepID=A0A1V0SJQ2_9VIRU|nr:hypothetical protein Klosneuvirus_3_80 [Klosneuvirus KNV1]
MINNNNIGLIILIWIVFAIVSQALIFYFITLPKLESGQYDQYQLEWTQDIEQSNYL